MTLLVMCVTGAWADAYTTIYSFTVSKSLGKNTVHTATGGTFYSTKDGESKADAIKMDFDNTSTKYVKITLTNPIAEDDIIRITMYQNGTNSPNNAYGVGIKLTANGDDVTTLTIPTASGKSSSSYTYTITSTSSLRDQSVFYIGRYNGNSISLEKVEVIHAKEVAGESLKGSAAVKVGDATLTLNAATSGYSVSGTTITISDDITVLSAPENIKLVKTITYTDTTTDDEDVAVTFDGTVTSGYFIGTATINSTDYTVRVKKDATPSVELSENSGTITLLSYQPSGNKTVTLTGANLVDGSYNVTASVDGTTIAPTSFTVADGEVNQVFTITSTASSAASTVFTFGTSAMGIAAPTYTLSYSKTAKRSVSQSTISTATSWTWADRASANIQLSNSTDPVKDTDFLLAEIAEITNSASFNSQALVVNGEFPYRKEGDNEFFQGQYIKFKTTVPGKLTVVYAGTNNNARRLQVNGKNYGDATATSSGNTTYKTASNIPVAAGDVIINGYQSSVSYLRFKSVSFTPLGDDEGDIVAVTDATYATHVLADDIDFTQTAEVTAYKAQVDGDVIKLIEVEQAPAGTPLILAASKEVYELVHAASTPAAVTGNDLEAGSVTGDGASHYVLGKEGGKVGFGLLADGVNLPATKAYIAASKFTAPAHFYPFDGETTGIEAVEAKTVENNVFYNLAGQQVAQPTKGLYIVNGRKVIVK